MQHLVDQSFEGLSYLLLHFRGGLLHGLLAHQPSQFRLLHFIGLLSKGSDRGAGGAMFHVSEQPIDFLSNNAMGFWQLLLAKESVSITNGLQIINGV